MRILNTVVSEFKDCARNLRDFEIKGNGNKRKTVSKMFSDDYDYNQERKILEITHDKFNSENIKDMSKRNAIATNFTHSIEELIDILTSTQTSIEDYIQATFQYEETA